MKKKNIRLNDLDLGGILNADACEKSELDLKTDIAIIGISAKVGNIDCTDTLWNEVLNGQHILTSEFPAKRFSDIKEYLKKMGIENPQPEMFVEEAYLDNISDFDAQFFNVLPNDAIMMDPAQRIMLETAWDTFQDAGYSQSAIGGSNTGVYIGYSVQDRNYSRMMEEINSELYDKNLSGTVNSVIAGRISYCFDLKGPAVMIDTACSSSLVAVHMACQSLLSNECIMALAGGIRYYLIPEQKRTEENEIVSVISADGKTKTFDDGADGTNSGEGVAAVLLKPLTKALADGDNIYAVIKATAINQDGSSIGITAPNSKAQKEVICKAWEKAKINPETISYIEAHGTGTKLGDPVEITGINEAFSEYTKKKNFCAVTSLKATIGHQDCAAGIFGLIRAVLAMKYKKIPSSLNFRIPNKKIDFIDSPVYVNDCLSEWVAEYPRRAGISSFGISGTNSHVLIEEAPKVEESEELCGPYILTLSIKDLKSKNKLLNFYKDYFEKTEQSLENICYTSNISRSEHMHRYAFILNDKREFSKLVDILYSGEESEDVFYQKYSEQKNVSNKEKYTQELIEIVDSLKCEKNINNRTDLLRRLAKAYINGADFDWERLKIVPNARKISLPRYPYNRQKYWVELKNQVTNNQNTENDILLGKKHLDSLDIVVFENIMSTETHAELREHIIGNSHVLAGTVYIETIQRAIEEISGIKSMEIEKLVFLSPMVCDTGKMRRVHIVILLEDNRYNISIQSSYVGENKWIKHATAEVRTIEQIPTERIDVISEEKRIKSQSRMYTGKSSTETLVKVGPRWNPEKDIVASKQEVFSRIKIPETFSDEIDQYHLYPPMLDASINAGSILNGEKLYLPYYFGRLRIYGRIPNVCCSYLKKRENDNDVEVTSFDGKIFNLDGKLIAEFDNYSMKKIHERERENFMGYIDSRYHVLSWKNNKLNGLTKKINSCIVVRRESQYDDAILRKLKLQCGKNLKEIILSDVFRETDDGNFYVSNENEQEYAKCLDKWYTAGQLENIVFLASKDLHRVTSKTELRQKYRMDLKSLYYITRVISNDKKYSGINLLLITGNAVYVSDRDSFVISENTLTFGMGKALLLENTRINVKCIDIDEKTDVDIVLHEMETESDKKIVSYREGVRYTQNVGVMKTVSEATGFNIKNDGIYIITGGLGGAGMVLAEKLVENNQQVKIALINRSVFPDRQSWESIILDKKKHSAVQKIKRIEKMEEQGATIEIIGTDISDVFQMDETLSSLRKKYGKINGIVHAAGVAGGGLIMRKEWDDFEQVLYPKVDGTWILNKLTQEDCLDFFVLFSSYSSVFCETGQADYIVANSYLDTFAYQNSDNKRKILTLNWTGWSETGMASDNNVSQKGSTVKFMNNVEAAEAFSTALMLKQKQVLVGEYDYPIFAEDDKQNRLSMYLDFDSDIEHNIKSHSIDKTKEIVQSVQVSGKTTGSLTKTEQTVADIWGKTLGITEIEYDAKFLEIGGDSLSATYLQKGIEKEYPGVMDITDVFVYSSVRDMAEYIDSKIKPQNKKKLISNKTTQEDADLVELLKMVGSGQMKVKDANKLL